MPPAPLFEALLRDVSRSFHLSIRLLPAGLRHPVGVAYLLARATDTVADTASADPVWRQALLTGLGESIAGDGEDRVLVEAVKEFASLQAHAGERLLLERIEDCLGALRALPAADLADVRTVLGHIVHGQSLDIRRFEDTAQGVPDAEALREYTYLVAGSVGEFWTDMCARHVPGFAQLPHQEMRALGRSFGCGLQLVNIVRDAGEDMRAGRCYFPADEIAAEGLEPVWRRWQATAGEHLADGLRYAQAVNSRRVRSAVALPALLGRRTLSLLRDAGPRALEVRVKVPRHEVRWLLVRLALRLASRNAIASEWDNRAR